MGLRAGRTPATLPQSLSKLSQRMCALYLLGWADVNWQPWCEMKAGLLGEGHILRAEVIHFVCMCDLC